MKKISVLTFFLVSFGYVLAQNIETEIDPDATVPVDGGIVTVTLIAAAYGAKRKSKQNKESNDDI
jgi:hypothetical protein